MARKSRNDPWDACTWEGARREQLRRWRKLTLRQKLQAVEAVVEMNARFAEFRRRRSSRTTARAT
jgi:hypothetical protein